MSTEHYGIRMPADLETARTAALTAMLRRECFQSTTVDGHHYLCLPRGCADFSTQHQVTGDVPAIVIAGLTARFIARFHVDEPSELTLVIPEDLGDWDTFLRG